MKQRNFAWVGRLVAAFLLALALLAPLGEALAAGSGTLILKTDTGDHNYNIEIATTNREKALGLMYRRSLPENSGMLFLYDRPQHASMWMKNTYIPLDMIFIAPDGTVQRIEANTEPFSLRPIDSGGEVIGVLELNAGQAGRIGLKRGDKVIYPGLASGRSP